MSCGPGYHLYTEFSCARNYQNQYTDSPADLDLRALIDCVNDTGTYGEGAHSESQCYRECVTVLP